MFVGLGCKGCRVLQGFFLGSGVWDPFSRESLKKSARAPAAPAEVSRQLRKFLEKPQSPELEALRAAKAPRPFRYALNPEVVFTAFGAYGLNPLNP